MRLDDSVSAIKGVGPSLVEKFAKLGVHTIAQLVDYYPRKYNDFSEITPISKLKPGVITLKARITGSAGRYARRGMHITEAVASDETGSVRLIWFNQPYRKNAIKPDTEYFISGEYVFRNQRLSVINPSIELASDFPINTARIVPVYREVGGLTSLQIRKALKELVPEINLLDETLPPEIVSADSLMARSDAIMNMHFPSSSDMLALARKRLGFEEVFQLALASLLNKRELGKETAIAIPFNEKLAKKFVSKLPFTLTDDQKRVIWQIYLDLQQKSPMNRLVEGDVGSGKTVVAAMAAIMVMNNGYQAAMMAPTELLARQHYESIKQLLGFVGLSDKVGLLVGGMSAKEKEAVRNDISAGIISFIIGTHALIQDSVDIHRLSLVIIDEQHRFGVEQRKKLQSKAGHAVHVLSTTATPIPRSLALTVYGELDISVIRHKPQDRRPIKTKLVSPNSRKQLNDAVAKELEHGRQMFVVCPLIEDSDLGPETSTETAFKEMKKAFPDYTVAQLHGRLRSAEKDRIMSEFIDNRVQILVSTTVIEVGVHVPNATVMVIENAERFGLAQAHQLRGRVGRSSEQGYCYLVLTDSTPPSPRLRALETSSDGFRLAELDLEIRGPGAIYGSMQHGQIDLRVAKLSDTELISSARQSAKAFLDQGGDLVQYPLLHRAVTRLRAVTNLN